jgi:hypothetical protein
VSQHEAALRKMGWRMKTHRGEGLWEDPRQPEVFHSMCSALAQAMVYAVQRLDELEARGAKGGSALEPTVVWRGSVSDFVTDLRPLLSEVELYHLAAELAARAKGYLPTLKLVEDRTPEQLAADGDEP